MLLIKSVLHESKCFKKNSFRTHIFGHPLIFFAVVEAILRSSAPQPNITTVWSLYLLLVE
jgi:hypothetical protein